MVKTGTTNLCGTRRGRFALPAQHVGQRCAVTSRAHLRVSDPWVSGGVTHTHTHTEEGAAGVSHTHRHTNTEDRAAGVSHTRLAHDRCWAVTDTRCRRDLFDLQLPMVEVIDIVL